MNTTNTCASCGAIPTSQSPSPCCANPQLRREARATSADPALPSAAVGALPPPTAAERAATAAKKAAKLKRQAQELDNQLYTRLCQLVAMILEKADQKLSDSQLLRLLQKVKSLRKDYVQQPPFPGPDLQRRRRIQALFRLQETLQQAVKRMTSKAVRGRETPMGCFTLDPDWRTLWCDLLAD